LVSGRYFETLGVSAARGRLLTSTDVDTASPVAVVSDGYWRRLLGADDTAIGQSLVVNGVNVIVVGVSRPGFAGVWTDSEAEVWLPLTLQPVLHYQNNFSGYGRIDSERPWAGQDLVAWLNIVARVSPDDVPQATTALQRANHLRVTALAGMIENPKSREGLLAHTLVVEPFARGFSGLRSRYVDALFALTAMVVLVLIVTCANIANLFLSRAAGRTREISVRLSLGAAPGRLVRQDLTESITLALIGGAAGVLVGMWVSHVLAREVLATSSQLPLVFSPDARMLGLGFAVSVAMGVVFGLAPALRAIAIARARALATNQRQAVGHESMKGMRSLVVGQLAVSAVIVFAAALFGRTLVNYMTVDPGFVADRLVTVSFDPVASGYSAAQMPPLGDRLVTAARSVPGVQLAAVARCGLVAGCSSSGEFNVDAAGTGVTLHENWVSADYFRTTGIPLVRGRVFEDRDAQRPDVAIINESLARRYFAGRNPLGLRLGTSVHELEIIGVVGDAHTQTLHEPPVPMVYFPIDHDGLPLQTALTNLDVRVAGDPAGAPRAIREAIHRAEPNLLLDDVVPMSQRLAWDLNRERIVTWLAFCFAALALILAALGLYGVLSYNVARRTQEIGVRMALGAQRRDVMASVLGQSAQLTVLGLVIGLMGIFASARSLAGMLYDVPAFDPLSLAAVLFMFVMVTTAASYLPARRATRVDPLTALRSE